ncbi:SLBB domain-containing protein [Chlorobium sp. KB01]|uniref:SLBB domain-containing protein n=1 Tax=Chlorobium sp. KB01 TaxID=1917528 RepID=UPI0009781BB0|nr:SLBB domain-containing protein [Chlorobium sp. KB01]
MRATLIVLFAFSLFALPVNSVAADNTGSASATSTADSGAFQSPAAGTGIPVITSPASEAREASVREAAAISAEQDKTADKLTGFQTFVEGSTGIRLDVFGRDLFRNVPTTFAPLKAAQVNADYVVGPGDALQIRGWGMVDIDVNVTVNRNGEIYLPRVGTVNVSGVKYYELQGYLKKAVGRIFKNFELTVSIAQTRSVQIYVVGHAVRPGSYTLSAMSSVLNALFASGGPSSTGSMRNIKVKRSGAPLVTFDLYDILLHGDKSSDVALRDGDVVYIPSVGPLVALLGDVKKPAIFELKERTSFADVVSWAGGFEAVAGLQKVIVERSIDHQYQTVAELQADWGSIQKSLSQFDVHPTDIIRVIAPGSVPIKVKIEKSFVRVDGEVTQSGVFQVDKGETLRALITRLGGTTEKGYVFGTKLIRDSLKREQQLKIDESVDRYEKDIQTNAKQRLAGQSDPAQAATIAAELESQQRLLTKLRQVKAEGRIILNLKNAAAQVADLPDLPLEDGDVVYVPQKSTTVDVIGAVYQQNTIIYSPDRGVNDYLKLSGGVSATGDKSELYRICADGTVRSKRNSGFGGDVNPGDAIVVPEKIQRGANFMQSLKDITSILYQFGIGAAAFKNLKN